MAYTKAEIKKIAPTSQLTGFVPGSPATIVSTDTIREGLEKAQGQIDQLQVQVGTVQVGNNLFNYYNFK